MKIEEFYSYLLRNASAQFKNSDGTQEPGKKFGCIGKFDGETESKAVVRKCEGIVVEQQSVPQQINCTVSAHIPVSVLRDLFGFHTNGLKEGVFAYGKNAAGKNFTFTAEVEDLMRTAKKLIALPNCAMASGFKWSIENGADEVAEVELEFTAMADEMGEFIYEAFESEITDQEVTEQWHVAFMPELVKQVA